MPETGVSALTRPLGGSGKDETRLAIGRQLAGLVGAHVTKTATVPLNAVRIILLSGAPLAIGSRMSPRRGTSP